jgi:serine O-acetyltransferase
LSNLLHAVFENIRADLRAHQGDWAAQGFWALCVYRFGQWRYTIRFVPLRKAMSALYRVAFKLVQIATGIEIPCEARIGPGLVIDHSGGIVVSGYATIGRNCRLRNGVVIGLATIDRPLAPTIGDDVDIGTGAKILGDIRVGSRVLIGANAVVIRDVPDDCIAVGVPAVVKPRRAR